MNPSPKAAAPKPAAALVTKPWVYLGLSKSAFYRLRAAGGGPKPVRVPGTVRPVWRVSDLDRWVASLKPAQFRKSDHGDAGQAGDGPTAA